MDDSSTTQIGGSLPPDTISDELFPVVEELGLVRNCRQLASEGWTVIEDAADPNFISRLREALLNHGTGLMMLGKNPVYSEAAINPKVMAVAEFSIGRGFLLSGLSGTVRRKGDPVTPLHADQSMIPAPFPDHNMMLVACWVTDEYSKAGGATLVIPGTKVLRRPPHPEEMNDLSRAIAIEAPAGSVAIWEGSLWHGNWPRTIEGERVVLHSTYCRFCLRPGENYAHVADELIDTYGKEMSQLLGREDYLDKKDFDWDNDPRFAQTRYNVGR